ncbi:MAG: hypothetical protein ACRDS0_38740 [Pseudonocardiaceae bacterium]
MGERLGQFGLAPPAVQVVLPVAVSISPTLAAIWRPPPAVGLISGRVD